MSSRSIAAALAVLLSIILLLNLRSLRSTGHVPDTSWRFEFSRDANSHSLSETQCNAAFPRLFENIDDAVSARTRNKDWVKPEELEIPAGRCMLRVLIYEGEVRYWI